MQNRLLLCHYADQIFRYLKLNLNFFEAILREYIHEFIVSVLQT